MERKVSVADREPVLSAECTDGFERIPGLVAAPPPALRVGEARERVENRVEVGRDVEAEHLDVVADVADHRRRLCPNDVHDAKDEARPANASRENGDVHAWLLSSSSAARQA